MLETSNEPILDDANNIDIVGRGEEFLPWHDQQRRILNGAPDGWAPPGPPPTWGGYQPKGNAPQSAEGVDNPGSWSLYSLQQSTKADLSI